MFIQVAECMRCEHVEVLKCNESAVGYLCYHTEHYTDNCPVLDDMGVRSVTYHEYKNTCACKMPTGDEICQSIQVTATVPVHVPCEIIKSVKDKLDELQAVSSRISHGDLTKDNQQTANTLLHDYVDCLQGLRILRVHVCGPSTINITVHSSCAVICDIGQYFYNSTRDNIKAFYSKHCQVVENLLINMFHAQNICVEQLYNREDTVTKTIIDRHVYNIYYIYQQGCAINTITGEIFLHDSVARGRVAICFNFHCNKACALTVYGEQVLFMPTGDNCTVVADINSANMLKHVPSNREDFYKYCRIKLDSLLAHVMCNIHIFI